VQALFIIIPLAAVIVLNIPYKKEWRKSAKILALFVVITQMLMTLTASSLVWTDLLKITRLNLIANFGIDFFSLTVLFTIGLIAMIALIYGKSSNKSNFNFVNIVLLAVMGMNGVAIVRDVFALYVFLEITAIASFILIVLDKNLHSFEGSFKYLIMSAVATVFMLSAIAILFMTVHSVNFDAIAKSLKDLNGIYSPQIITALVLFITGLFIKAGMVPFHGWLPDAYMSAPSEVSIFLAGIVTKVAGVYTIMRLQSDVFAGIPVVTHVMMAFGALTIIVGALGAIGQTDFKRILAYSSISQVGYIILAAGIGTPLAFAGALLHFFNHATFKSLLFVNSAAVEEATGTREIDKLGGLASKMPVTGFSSIIGFLSTSGIPPLSGFWSKLIIVIAAWTAQKYAYSIIAVIASLITLTYFLILQRKVFFGKLADGLEKAKEGGLRIVIPSIILSLIIIAIGVLFPLAILFLQSNGFLKLI
jgi:multicomponent Na+:H+ antiporter subunit D